MGNERSAQRLSYGSYGVHDWPFYLSFVASIRPTSWCLWLSIRHVDRGEHRRIPTHVFLIFVPFKSFLSVLFLCGVLDMDLKGLSKSIGEPLVPRQAKIKKIKY